MSNDAIRPFVIAVSDGTLDDLKQRLANTRWPEKETVDDWSQGIPLAYTQEVCDYWLNSYDWRAREALLNKNPQFITELNGLDIHFIHARSPHPQARPLLMTHGWPGPTGLWVFGQTKRYRLERRENCPDLESTDAKARLQYLFRSGR